MVGQFSTHGPDDGLALALDAVAVAVPAGDFVVDADVFGEAPGDVVGAADDVAVIAIYVQTCTCLLLGNDICHHFCKGLFPFYPCNS